MERIRRIDRLYLALGLATLIIWVVLLTLLF
jgi:hypothetical protein